MSTKRLKGRVGIVVAGVALAALAILAVLPGMAEAQEEAGAQGYTGTATSVEAEQNTTTDEKVAPAARRPAPEPSRTRLVVEPGDSLWSISEKRIGQGATPEQIAYEVERIFELNRDQIGEDPNQIFPGQELFLAPAGPGGGRAAAVPEEPVVAEQQAPKPPGVVGSQGVSDLPAVEEVGPVEDVVSEDGAPEDSVSQDYVPAQQTPDSTDEQAESAAPTENVPAESTPATTTAGEGIVGSVFEAYDNLKGERRLLGVGIIALTLIAAALMAWRLPMRRGVEDPQSWGIPRQQYHENSAPAGDPPELSRAPEGEPGSSASGAASEPPPEEAKREPGTSSSPAAREAEGGAAAGSAPDRERLRRVRSLRRIRQRRSPREW